MKTFKFTLLHIETTTTPPIYQGEIVESSPITPIPQRETRSLPRARSRFCWVGLFVYGTIIAIGSAVILNEFSPAFKAWGMQTRPGQFSQWVVQRFGKGKSSVTSPPPIGKLIADGAKTWQGKNFNAGKVAQCMFFVRHVIKEATGKTLPVTQQPFDSWAKQPNAVGMARSLSGLDIGKQITTPSALQPGDIVFFFDTYEYGKCRRGSRCITHVGIYIGNGNMIDRSTRSRPVQLRPIDTFQFAVAVRLNEKTSYSLSSFVLIAKILIATIFFFLNGCTRIVTQGDYEEKSYPTSVDIMGNLKVTFPTPENSPATSSPSSAPSPSPNKKDGSYIPTEKICPTLQYLPKKNEFLINALEIEEESKSFKSVQLLQCQVLVVPVYVDKGQSVEVEISGGDAAFAIVNHLNQVIAEGGKVAIDGKKKGGYSGFLEAQQARVEVIARATGDYQIKIRVTKE